MDDLSPIVKRLTELYVSERYKYLAMYDNKNNFTRSYAKGKFRLKDKDIWCHLAGKYCIGVFAAGRGARFICFDVDIDDLDIVRKVRDGLVDYGFPAENIYVSASGGKGYHVEMFFDGEIPVERLREIYMYVTERGHLPRRKVEFRPAIKQAIKLPLGVHRETRRVCWFLDQNTFEPICGDDGYNYVFQIGRLGCAFAEALVDQHRDEYLKLFPPRPERPAKQTYDAESFPKVDGDNLITLKEPHTRHNAMVSIAVYLFSKGLSQEEIFSTLMDWYEKQDKSLISSGAADVEADAAKIANWVMKNGYRYADPFILRSDLEVCLAQPTRVRRKLAFLLAAFGRRHGKVEMSGARIGTYVGATENYVVSAIREMSKRRLVCIAGGNRGRRGSSFSCEANTYSWRGCDGASEPIKFAWDFKAETFMDAWCAFIVGNVSPDCWKKIFTAKELKELNNYLEEHQGG